MAVYLEHMKRFLWRRTTFVSKFGQNISRNRPFLTENARLGSFFDRFNRIKVAYDTQGTICNKKPIDTMPVSVLVKEPIHPPNVGNR